MSERIFAIREILEVVFDSLEPHSNATNARVCKFWSEIALDLLWKRVDKFYHLINILGSTRTTGRYITLQSSITLADWQRFAHYGHRIRELCFDDHAGAGRSQSATTVVTEILREIARTRISLKILPNLRSLTWLAEDSERRELSVLFMHDGVTHYTTYAGHSSVHNIDVARRMPSVTHLDLRMHMYLPGNLVEAAVGFPNLKEIILPRYSPTADVIEALAKLENLETIKLNNDAESSYLGTQKSVDKFSPRLEEGSFPALTSLDFILHINDETNFFQSPHFPPNLTVIRLHAMSVPDHGVLRGLFTAISSRYPNLQSLSVACTDVETVSSSSQPWTIDTIRPIFACTKLTVLDILHNTPISLTTEDLTEISKAWSPTIETLQLNPQPFMDLPTAGSSLTLASLFPFALNCPKLQNLGLYINATVADLPPVVPTPFQSLKCFHVGSSSITSPAKVAKSLSCLFPPGCVINEKWLWELDPEISDKTSEALDLWADSWAEVGLLLPTLISAAMDSREIIRSLEERVRELEKEKEAWQLRDLVKSFK